MTVRPISYKRLRIIITPFLKPKQGVLKYLKMTEFVNLHACFFLLLTHDLTTSKKEVSDRRRSTSFLFTIGKNLNVYDDLL